MPERQFNSTEYPFAFNGKYKDDEIACVVGAHYDFGAREYDSRIGRWWNCDAKASKYPFSSPFVYALNNPILFIDPDGQEVVAVNEEAKQNIINTLRPEDRKYVKFNKNGVLNVNRLNKAQSESGNYSTLLTLANSKTVYKFVVAKEYKTLDKDGNVITEPLVGDDKNGTKGVTLLSGNENDPSLDNDVWIFTSGDLSGERQTENTAHEGYGHAYFFELKQQGVDVNPNHKYQATSKGEYGEKGNLIGIEIGREETNTKLGEQIEKSEKEAVVNYKLKNK